MSLQLIIDPGHTADYTREHPSQFNASVWTSDKGKAVMNKLGLNNSDSVEHALNVALADTLHRLCKEQGIQSDLIDWPNMKNDAEITRVINYTNARNPKLFVSVHGNASGVGDWKNMRSKATGAVVLHHKVSSVGRKLADKVSQSLLKCRAQYHGYDNRAERTKTSGVGVLSRTSCPAILIEVCFYDNLDDLHWTVTHLKEVSQAIIDGIKEYLI